MAIPERVRTAIEQAGWIADGERIIAAVSGGPDSLCLMHVLHELGVELVAAHFDHRLREGSETEAGQVRGMAAALGVPFECGRAPTPGPLHHGGVEASARRNRYAFLAAMASRHDCRTIATGHTADDRIETLLMHLVRGAGTSGLRGMKSSISLSSILGHDASAAVRVVRPLLGITRQETEAYCRDRCLEPIQDPSNRDTSYLRNRVRWELIPYLETFNPSVRDALLRAAIVLDGEAAWRDQILLECRGRVLVWDSLVSVGISLAELRTLPIAMQRALLHEVLESLLGLETQASFVDVERLRGMSEGGVRRLSLTGGIEAERAGGQVIVVTARPDEAIPIFPQCRDDSLRDLAQGSVDLESGWCMVQSSLAPAPDRPAWTYVGPFDGEESLIVRRARQGERIEAEGYSGAVKVSGLLAGAGVPRPARERWPLLIARDRACWVAGIRKARQEGGRGASGVWVYLQSPDERFLRWRERGLGRADASVATG